MRYLEVLKVFKEGEVKGQNNEKCCRLLSSILKKEIEIKDKEIIYDINEKEQQQQYELLVYYLVLNDKLKLLTLLNRNFRSNFNNSSNNNRLENYYLNLIITLMNVYIKEIKVYDDTIIYEFQKPFKLLISSKSDSGLNVKAIKFFSCELFKLLFRFSKLNAIINMFKVLQNSKKIINLDEEISDGIELLFKFFIGKCYLIQNNLSESYQYFSKCFERVSKLRNNNLKFKVLNYLIPLNLILYNRLPTNKLLNEFHELIIFKPILESIRNSNLNDFNNQLNKLQLILLKSNIYSLYVLININIEYTIVKRTFKVWFELNQSFIMPLSALTSTFGSDSESIESKLVNLISIGKIKGYISHSKQVIVLSKREAFPAWQ